MAFDPSKLCRVGPQNGNVPTLWTYASDADAITDVDGTGFFNAAADQLKVNDIIFVAPASGAAGILKVASNTRNLDAVPPVSGVVDTLNGLSLGTIDSD